MKITFDIWFQCLPKTLKSEVVIPKLAFKAKQLGVSEVDPGREKEKYPSLNEKKLEKCHFYLKRDKNVNNLKKFRISLPKMMLWLHPWESLMVKLQLKWEKNVEISELEEESTLYTL